MTFIFHYQQTIFIALENNVNLAPFNIKYTRFKYTVLSYN